MLYFCPVTGTTVAHNEITFNTTAALKKKSDCKTFRENIKLEVIKEQFYTYPDVMVTCDARDLDDTLVQQKVKAL